MTSTYTLTLVRTDSGGGGREAQDNPTGWRIPSFIGRKSRGAFWQPAFFLAKNRMTTVAFKKEMFWKVLMGCLPKRLLDSNEVLKLEKKTSNISAVFLMEGESSSYEICLRGFHVGFFPCGELVLF